MILVNSQYSLNIVGFFIPFIKARNKLLHELKVCSGKVKYLKQRYRDVRSNIKNTVSVAKEK